MPLTTQAYLTPEEVLDDSTMTTRFYAEPVSDRELDDQVRRQQEESAARRKAEQDALKPQVEPEEEEMHGAAPDEEETDLEALIKALQELQGASSSSAADDTDAVSQRLLERIQQRQEDAQREAMLQQLLGNDQTLHSGAPLSDTGPAAILTVLAMAGAVGETWRRVRKAQRTSQM
jgi:hypothetical protein